MELSRILLGQVIVVMLLMLIGLASFKGKLINHESVKQFTKFVLNIVTPCVLIEAYQKEFDIKQAYLLLTAFASAILIHFVVIVISHLVFRKEETLDYRVNRFASVYSNCGFMAIPLLDATLGSDGVFFGSAYLAVFSVLQWTHGAYVCSEDKKSLLSKKVFLNAGVIGTVISLILFVFGIKLPKPIFETVSYTADLNTPLALILVGTYLAGIKPKTIIKNFSFYKVMIIRLIIAPIITIYLLKLLNVDLTIIKALTISASCPVAGVTSLWAAKENLNVPYASSLVAITTILSIITIPLVVLFI